ncbi:Transmembrane protein [Trichinella pseudospiralis]
MFEICNAQILSLQVLLLMLDLCFNIATPLFFWSNTAQLMLFAIQDTCIVMALIILFLTIFTTHVFQAGLIMVLFKRFQYTVWAWLIYLVLSLTFHICSLQYRNGREYEISFGPGLVAVYTIHRLCAVIYYHLYKRSALIITDPKYQSFSYLKELSGKS